MKKIPVFIFLLMFLILLTACGLGETMSQDSPVQRIEDVSFLYEEGNVSESRNETEERAGNEGGNDMAGYDFSVFTNVELIGVDLSAMSEEQLSVLYQQARYCQAMTEADTDTMREMVSEDAVFTHMSGRQQTREEYFADIENGGLQYFTIGIDSPVVEVDGDVASVTYTSVLNANAYGARGTYRMGGTHWFEKRDGSWISLNAPER